MNIDLTEGKYLEVWGWIQKARRNNKSWEEIKFGFGSTEDELSVFLHKRIVEDFWPDNITKELFWEIIDEQRRIEDNQDSGFISSNPDKPNPLIPSPIEGSAWQCYKETLKDNHFDFETRTTIENTTAKILSYLSNNTYDMERNDVVKGLVIGNVQSGKTANMEALMSMTADNGWNMYIILSGTIENLRKQTQQRFKDDLFKHHGTINWDEIDRPELGKSKSAQELYLKKTDNIRYFTVCLKNSTRLNRLIKWLQADKNQMKNMRILVIDDESDQAGVNTANIDEDEKTKIYKCITNLINQKTVNDEIAPEKFGAMNYIGYTATPYANMLNDPRCESLYPKNFISTLSVSHQYFGPQQIFGNDDLGYRGLPIVNEIDEDEIANLIDLHLTADAEDLPVSLKESLLWFICGAACMRSLKSTKPVSMLIHTSQKTDHHANIAKAIQQWLDITSIETIIDECESIWKKQTEKFDFEKLTELYSDYKVDENTFKEYPSFETIKPFIKAMLSISDRKYTHIELSDDKKKEFNRGIHICVDNCKNTAPKNNPDDGTYYHLRLAYPGKDDKLDFAPAFIVIGGATLSRGLTIEGLISSYFLRSVGQADSLMQMGRWFGYRKGYELLPRLWLTEDTIKQFKYLSSMDNELRDTIKEMEKAGKSPYDYRIRIKLPKEQGLIALTSKNKMQSVKEKRDYSGTYKQTYKFDNNEETMQHNIEAFETFLDKLGAPQSGGKNKYGESAQIWKCIRVETILSFLESYKFSQALPECENVVKWIKTDKVKNVLGLWNVVLAGNKNPSDKLGVYEHNDYSVNKVNRSKYNKKLEENDSIINLGTLRNPFDLIADIDISKDQNLITPISEVTASKVKQLRRRSSEKETPQLLIYVVSANSTADDDKENRISLGINHDLIGLSINIPEQSESTADEVDNEYYEIDFEKYGIKSSVDIKGEDE